MTECAPGKFREARPQRLDRQACCEHLLEHAFAREAEFLVLLDAAVDQGGGEIRRDGGREIWNRQSIRADFRHPTPPLHTHFW